MRAILLVSILTTLAPTASAVAQREAARDASGTRRVVIAGAEHVLDPVYWLLVGRDGSIYLPADDELTIRRFTARGAELAAFGRRGGGPGELRRADWAGWLGDTLWVNDSRQNRTVFFDPSGRHITQTRWPTKTTPALVSSSTGTEVPVPIFPAAWTSTRAMVFLAGAPAGMVIRDRSATQPPDALLLRAEARTGQELGRAALRGRPSTACSTYLGARPRGMSVRIPHCPDRLHHTAPDGGSFAWLTQPTDDGAAGGYRIVLLSVTGDTLVDATASVTRPTIPAASRDAALRDLLTFIRELRRELEPQARAVALPVHYPSVDAVLAGPGARVWVRTPGDRADRVVWRCHAPRSAAQVEVVLPRAFRAKAVRDCIMTGTEFDSDGVEDVVQYTVGGC